MEYKKIIIDGVEKEIAIHIDEDEIEQNFPPKKDLEDTIEIIINKDEYGKDN